MDTVGFGVCEGFVCARCGMDLRTGTSNFSVTVPMHQEGCSWPLKKQHNRLCWFCKFFVALFVFCAIASTCGVLRVHCIELVRHASICLRMPSMLDTGGLPSLQSSIVQLLGTCGSWNTDRNEGNMFFLVISFASYVFFLC